MKRRTFLKLAGMGSLSFAAGCSDPQKSIYSLVEAPDDMVVGNATWYASTCRECPAGCGILAKNREGRVIKLEGNPLHPINIGTICMRGQAALQALYNPDRIRTPLLKQGGAWRPISFKAAQRLIMSKTGEAAQKGRNRVRMVTDTPGDSIYQLMNGALGRWNSGRAVVFEPFAYESLRKANEDVFSVDRLISYRMEDADVLVAFGADFLETWLSPVEYARKFKEMHAFRNGDKGVFMAVGPYMSLTGANADAWLPCRPGGETAIVLGLIGEALQNGRGTGVRDFVRDIIQRAAEPYSRARVMEVSGLSPSQYDSLKERLFSARRPLVLGTGTGDTGGNSFQTNMAVNLLNAVLDPKLAQFDFESRQRVEMASRRSEILALFAELTEGAADVLMIHNVDPVFQLPPGSGARAAMERDALFVVSFSNFMDDTSRLADLIFPTRMPLESWDEYEGKKGFVSMLQPAIGQLTDAPQIGDVLLNTAFTEDKPAGSYKSYLMARLIQAGLIQDERTWLEALRTGGVTSGSGDSATKWFIPYTVSDAFHSVADPVTQELVFIGMPSIRFFDGRGANRPWLVEIPDPITKVAWQTPLLVHPETVSAKGLEQGDVVKIQSKQGSIEAPVYESETVTPGVLAMSIGQGHGTYGRYAENQGINPVSLFPPDAEPRFGGPRFFIHPVSMHRTGHRTDLAHTDGSRIQHGRKIALSTSLENAQSGQRDPGGGLTMWDFPITLPLPEGYNRKRDFYPVIEYENYRWSMVVDLDRCIGCGACSAGCYAENNLGVVGEKQVLNGREMSWLRVERYHDPEQMEKITFLPMMCQHCDNAPCEAVCPVYAPHHSAEGLNNQIYNRCIGTRFCGQNCPYKVRRFNWFTWQWPKPMHLQLNPDVTVRSKGVMEKCSFCIQRIKAARNAAKNENRQIRDGEIVPACVQTCPTTALVFGNLMDPNSRVRRLVEDARAYQVMGYLNTKPAVIYLKKVVHEI
ncbi:Molybdopterin oxidoreductase, iron-sulfur binding subunit (EC [Olavius algarvensis associated proteobacterium Delta 3]|nr:Molybdopterin oxidoreductase, iron-sulfur binding subunit (EC [Olavius algarvensis associated proteobacterium Delta 3]